MMECCENGEKWERTRETKRAGEAKRVRERERENVYNTMGSDQIREETEKTDLGNSHEIRD